MFGFLGSAAQLMGAGFSAGQASALVGPVPTTAISAAGTTLATATALSVVTNLVSTATVGQGVKLPTAATTNDWCIVFNDNTGTTIVVYPDTSSNKINQMAAGTGINLPNNTSCIFQKVSSTRWIANLSA